MTHTSRHREAAPRRGPVWLRRWALLGAFAAVAAGLGVWALRPAESSQSRAVAQEYAPVTGAVTLPGNVLAVAPEVRAVYEFAARRPDVLRYLPCFCGCHNAGHRSNYDCFIDHVRADGSVTIDEMGFT